MAEASERINHPCDNFLIGDSGVAEKLHKFPQKIVELG